jgi:hypothetical protein
MSFAPENPLEELLMRAVRDASLRPAFYGLLLQSPLLAVGRVERHNFPDKVLPLLDAHHFELAQVTAKGKPYHPVFTAMSRLRIFQEAPVEYFTVIGRTLFENTRGAAFLVNFGSDVGKELLPGEIAHLLDHKPRQTKAASQNSIAIALPDPYPGKLTGALGIYFLNRSQVAAAHMVQAVISEREPAHLLIGLVASGNLRRIISEIGEVAAAMHTANIVDVMVVDPANVRSELQAGLLATAPFYARPVTPQSQSSQS